MKKISIDDYDEIKYVSEEEHKRMQEYINEYTKKRLRKRERRLKIVHTIKYIFYMPLSIAANVLSVLFKIAGSIASIGIPYGMYCLYKIILQLSNEVALSDINEAHFVFPFFLFPFIAFALSAIFEKVAHYLMYHW